MVLLKRVLFVFLTLGFFSLSAESQGWKKELVEIDKEIEYLQDLQRGLEGRATRYENKAQRFQFEQDKLVESKRFWKMAEQNRKAAADIQAQIDLKKDERKKLVEQHESKK
jgi:hypothetical protein